jgi:hypothetical protein
MTGNERSTREYSMPSRPLIAFAHGPRPICARQTNDCQRTACLLQLKKDFGVHEVLRFNLWPRSVCLGAGPLAIWSYHSRDLVFGWLLGVCYNILKRKASGALQMHSLFRRLASTKESLKCKAEYFWMKWRLVDLVCVYFKVLFIKSMETRLSTEIMSQYSPPPPPLLLKVYC